MFADDLRNMLKPLTDPGGEFEVDTCKVRGQEYRYFPGHPQSLRAYFEQFCDERADTLFMVYGDEKYTFGDSWRLAGQLAHQLQTQYGVGKGDRVAVSMRNYPEWVLTYMAAVSMGAVIVPMNAWWVQREMQYGLEDSGAKVLVADQERYDIIADKLPELDVVCIGARMPNSPEGVADCMELIKAAEGAEMPAVDVDPEDDASIMYTSGTTGFPKGALATHRLHSGGDTVLSVHVPGGRDARPRRRRGREQLASRHAAHRAAVPRHRQHRHHAVVLRLWAQDGDDVQVGFRRGAEAGGGRAHHRLHRCADHGLGNAATPGLWTSTT